MAAFYLECRHLSRENGVRCGCRTSRIMNSLSCILENFLNGVHEQEQRSSIVSHFSNGFGFARKNQFESGGGARIHGEGS